LLPSGLRGTLRLEQALLVDDAPCTSAWEDAADEYAALVIAWWQGDYANLGK
jgi:hypothetical protein